MAILLSYSNQVVSNLRPFLLNTNAKDLFGRSSVHHGSLLQFISSEVVIPPALLGFMMEHLSLNPATPAALLDRKDCSAIIEFIHLIVYGEDKEKKTKASKSNSRFKVRSSISFADEA